MDVHVDPDWAGASDRGAGDIGFAGTRDTAAATPTGLATVADASWQGPPQLPMLPTTWFAGTERR